MKHTNKILTLILLLLSFSLLFSCSFEETAKTQITESNDNKIPPESVSVPPEVEDTFNNAIASIVMLDERMTEQLKNDYQTQYGYPLSLNVTYAKPGDHLAGTFCYGNFADCIVIFTPSMLTVYTTKTIAGETFDYGSSFSILGYHEGVFYPLDEAYENGYITKEEVAAAAQRHKTIRQYNVIRSLYEKAE